MATASDISGSQSLYSDQVFDRNCTVCVDDNKISEAVCYCMVCYEYYCTQCRDFHNKFHRDHRDKLLDQAAMLKTQPKRPAPVALTTRCAEHSDKLVEMYCYDHDVVCCTVCLAIKHKKCAKTEFIPKIVNDLSKNPDISQIRSSLETIRQDLAAVKVSRQKDQTRIKQEKERVLDQVEEARQRMNVVFDRLEDAVMTEADTRYESCIISVQTDLQECNAAINKLKKSIKDIGDTDKQNKAQMFVLGKVGAEIVKEMRKTVNQINEKLGKEKIEFKVKDDFQKCLDRLDSLGEFVDEYMKHDPNRDKDGKMNVRGKIGVDEYMEHDPNRDKDGEKSMGGKKGTSVDEYMKHNPNQAKDRKKSVCRKNGADDHVEDYPNQTKDREKSVCRKGTDVDTLKGASKPRKVIRTDEVSIKTKGFSWTLACTVLGSCSLPDGGALLSDSHNNELKRLNPSHQITDTRSVRGIRGVCYIHPSHEAAVCVSGAIVILSLGKQMEVVRTIKMDGFNCHGVACYNGLLYVSEDCGDKLYVYDYATGQRSLTVNTDSQGKKIFSRTQLVATNADGSQIWVADRDNGLIQFDKACNVVRVVKTDQMGDIRGVCVDNEDNVYVCGQSPRYVLQLTSDGDKGSTLFGPDELKGALGTPGHPSSVSYDNSQSRLLVTMYWSDTMKVVYFK